MGNHKFLAATGIGAGLLAGSLGLASILPNGVAGAQTPTSTPASPTTTAPGTGAGTSAHPALRKLRQHELGVAASTIGVSPSELRTDVKNGQSISDVATAKGVPVDDVVNAIVKDVDARIDKAVTNGKLTQAQATTIEGKLPARVTKIVDAHRRAPATN
jgi:hypothetical protein